MALTAPEPGRWSPADAHFAARTDGLDGALRSTHAVVLAGGRGLRLKELTDGRAKPAVPFAGTLRIIDFTLANCVNSGLGRVSVLTQYKAQSLIRHVGGAWGIPGTHRGDVIDVVPAQQQLGEGWYRGTADAVHQNLDLLREDEPRYVLVLAGDHVYKMDYRRLVADHVRRDADVTVACVEVPLEDACAFRVMCVDDDARVREFAEKPVRPAPLTCRTGVALVSMGLYVFNAAFLYCELDRDAADPRSGHDFGCDILPNIVPRSRAFAHNFTESCVDTSGARPYWRDVGTLDAYWEANMDLVGPTPAFDLYDEAWPISGLQQSLLPARFAFDEVGRRGMAVDSLVCGGCIVSGATVRRSLLFPKARVGEAGVVEDSLLLPGAVVGRQVVLRRAIVDERCVLPDGIRIGVNRAEDRARFTVTDKGVVLVTPQMLDGAARGRVIWPTTAPMPRLQRPGRNERPASHGRRCRHRSRGARWSRRGIR
jgi:glucose-1-phosphate adenylyltransferase